MPQDRAHYTKYLNSFQMDAVVLNRPKIAKVARAYREARLDLEDAERMASLLASKNKKARDRGNEIYQHFLDRGLVGLKEKLKPRTEKQKSLSMRVILFTDRSKRDGEHVKVDGDEERYKRYERYLKRKSYRDKYHIFDVPVLHVTGTTRRFLLKYDEKLTEKGKAGWRDLYKICMTDDSFRNRELMAPGYVEAIMVLGVDKDYVGPVVDPAEQPMATAGDKVTITYRYCSNVLDLTKDTFAEAIKNERYVKNECFINSLYDFYGDRLLDPRRAQRYRISREDILKLLGKTEESVKEGLTIKEVLPFFEKFHLKLRVYDIFKNLVFRYDPPVDYRNNPPMNVMCHERHIYSLNDNLESLAQTLASGGDQEAAEEVAVRVGTDYRLKKDGEVGRKHKMIKDVDDIFNIMKEIHPENGEPNQDANWMIQEQDDLEKILFQMREHGHTPQVKFQKSGKLSMIVDRWNKQTFIIKTQQLTPEELDGYIYTNKAEVYDKIDEVFADMRNKIFKMEHKSYYNTEDMILLDTCRTVANVGWLSNPILDDYKLRGMKLVEIDMTKAFTWAFCQIKSIPIFNAFDIWRPWKAGSAIKPLNLYILRNRSFSLVGNKEHTFCYGKFLPENADIVAVKEPSFIKKACYKKIIEELMATEISKDPEDDKKFKKTIPNTCYGLLESHINKNSKSFIFDNYNDCKFYQAKFGGIIHQIKQYEEKHAEAINPLDAGIEGLGETAEKVEYQETDTTLYVLNIYAQADMTNGFRYIKELLMQTFNRKMQQTHDVLREAGIEVFTVKTDAFTIRASDLEKAKELLNVKMPEDPKEIGDWRFSKDCCIKYPQERLTLLANGIKEILEPTFHEIPMTKEEEYDVDKICAIFEERKRVMVRADYPGSGKSFACEHMEKRGHKVLFVCPTNKLASNYKDKGVTMNKFFGIGLTEETRHTPFDSSQYDTVVFDEIFFANIKNLSRIKRYCDEHPEKIIIATGDTDQLECIDLITNQKNYDEYCNFCINVIFPDSIKLKENKRLKSKEHQKLLKRIKKDIFNESLPVRDIIERYFKMVDKLTTSFNIAFKNKTCEDVSQKVRRMLGKTQEYEEGEVLVCRKYTKLNKSKIVFNVNYEYTITEVREGTLCLDGEVWLPIPLIQKAFTHNYCRTCHSFQGSSIDDGITIFDWGNFFVNRKWLWTAVTRARSLDSIYFWKYDEKPENMNKLMEYFEQKVKRYKGQDLKAKRPFDEDNYITPNWLRSCIGTACQRCGDVLNYEIVDRKVVCNLSAQRLDNTEPHEKDNCVPYCAMCNTIVSDRD